MELVKPEVAAAQVASCGFKTVRPKFEDILQEDIIEVGGIAFASKDQLECVAQASLNSHHYVTFPPTVETSYQPIYARLSEERGRTDAKTWLEKRGLLSRLPIYDRDHSNEATFIRDLETLCGPKASGTLKSMHGMGTFNDNALSSGKLDDETLSCLVYGAAASGYPFGFIGNERYGNTP